jgi:hypothetical protein
MTALRDRSAFEASVVRNFASTRLPVADARGYEEVFAARGLAPSATRRDTFELHVSRTRVRFGMPRYGLWWVDAEIPGGLDWSQSVVQIGHHSFNPAADWRRPHYLALGQHRRGAGDAVHDHPRQPPLRRPRDARR